jgi:hypothetical protein
MITTNVCFDLIASVFVQWCHLFHVVVVHRRGGVGRVGHSHEEACLSAAGELSAGGG